MNTNLVEVFPDPLVLNPSKVSNQLESNINIKNLTNDYVIFKIYNNQQFKYTVKPSTSFIPPMETAIVSVKRFKNEEIETSSKDKFLLIFHKVNRVIQNNQEVKQIFKSKDYMENEKQESMISIIINNEKSDDENDIEPNYSYNENDLNFIGDDYNKGIKIYNDLNENLKKESNKINQNLKDLEKILDMIKVQKKLKDEKEQAIKQSRNKSKTDNIANILLVILILSGLLFGANLSKLYNRAFKRKERVMKESIFNKSDNYINKKMNESEKNNQTLTKEQIDSSNSTNDNPLINDTKVNEIINEISNITNANNTINVNNNTNNTNNANEKIKNETDKEKVENLKNNEIKEKIEKEKVKEKEKEKDKKNINEKITEEEKTKSILNLSFFFGVYICLFQLLI